MIPLCELEGMKVICYTSSTLRKRKHKKAKKRKACEMKLRSGEKGGPPAFGWWWKVECCMLGYRKACCCTFDSYSSLKKIIRPQEWLCHSWLRMVQSLQITGVKRNVLFLQRASMRKLIKGKHEKRCSFLERKGDRRSRWIVDSTLFE